MRNAAKSPAAPTTPRWYPLRKKPGFARDSVLPGMTGKKPGFAEARLFQSRSTFRIARPKAGILRAAASRRGTMQPNRRREVLTTRESLRPDVLEKTPHSGADVHRGDDRCRAPILSRAEPPVPNVAFEPRRYSASPPARVNEDCQRCGSTLSDTKCTEPSKREAFTPPAW